MNKCITVTEAKKLGYIVDNTCYPWVAYKGSRFAPTDTRWVLTELEEEMLQALKTIQEYLPPAGSMDGQYKQPYREAVAKLETAIAKVKLESS